MQKNRVAAAMILAGALPFSVAAEQQLEPIVVTPSRTAQTADEALAAVTVITREDIERLQAVSVTQLLQGQTGVALVSNGGFGKSTALHLRGTASDHVLVMIDGIRAGSATLGGFAWQDLPVEIIDRIEIVRGPRSSVYGADAIGGVVQIFTRRGGGPLRPSFSAGVGSDSTHRTTASLSGGGDTGWLNLSAAHFETDGISACGRVNPEPFGSCGVEGGYDPDRDAYRRTSVALRGGYRFIQGTEIDLHLLHAEGLNEYDGSWTNEADFVQRSAGARLSTQVLPALRVQLTAGRSWDESDESLNGDFRDRFNTRRDTLSWENTLDISDHSMLVFGTDYVRDQLDSTTDYAETSRYNAGAFALYHTQLGAHTVEVSGRYDENEQFGGHTTGGVGWGYVFSPSLRLSASYATAFKAPTFNDLYFPWGWGNPDLAPEESSSIEAGLQGLLGRARWTTYIFQTEIDNLVANVGGSATSINRARIRGLEASLSNRLFGWETQLSATLLKPENRQGESTGNLLPRRPETSARVDVDRTFGRWGIGTTVAAEGRRYEDVANEIRLSGYARADLRASFVIAPGWQLEGQVANVFDRDYETAAYYNQQGRFYFAAIRYQPGTR